MNFLEMYGEGLDTELGSADRTERFTNARRRAAINFAQQEFVKETGCFQREGQISVTQGVAEYDLESLLDVDTFIRLSDQQPYLTILDGNGNTRVLTGKDFKRRDIPVLDRQDPGWRGIAEGTPTEWYIRHNDGTTLIGLNPTPSAPATETWTLNVPYIALPATMVQDTDEPFAISAGGNSKSSLRIYHKALVHRAAAELEKLRRNYAQVELQKREFMSFVIHYLQQQRETGGSTLVLSHDYFASAGRTGDYPDDPRR